MEEKVELKLIELDRAKELAEEELLNGENLTKLEEMKVRMEISNIKCFCFKFRS